PIAPRVAEATQCLADKSVGFVTIRDGDVNCLTAVNKRPNLVNGLESLDMELHDHAPMIPNSGPPSSSSVLGNTPRAQAPHVSLDKARACRMALKYVSFRLRQARSSVGQSTTLTWWGSVVRVHSRLPFLSPDVTPGRIAAPTPARFASDFPFGVTGHPPTLCLHHRPIALAARPSPNGCFMRPLVSAATARRNDACHYTARRFRQILRSSGHGHAGGRGHRPGSGQGGTGGHGRRRRSRCLRRNRSRCRGIHHHRA